MFGISGIELAIIIVVAFLIFGPDKLPGVIKNVTHIWEVLKSLRQQADQVIKAEVVEPLKDIEASVNPFVEEGKSATDMLAKKLGIKPDPPKKEVTKATEAAGEAKSEAKDEGAAEASSGAISEAAPQASKPKTESFAEKKAALERAHREKQQAEQVSAGAAAAASATDTATPKPDAAAPKPNTAAPAADETAGE
ncbi:MAG: twin-arginine translocase TatA/TatE family subunit [Coriobacteriia bacterium]|nr:twin-arginine translocase TatA/TatE family subunit [Coriobacteriia bacterium]MCL2750348.1 twin-arginine translocase TatA/TatE family subunit [Coriobacteriia bacterium]